MNKKLNLRNLTENENVEIVYNWTLDDCPWGNCKHVVDNAVPRVVWAKNEGGYNSTAICLDCLLEQVEEDDETSNYRVVSAEITNKGLDWQPVEFSRIRLEFKHDPHTLGFKTTVRRCYIWLNNDSLFSGYVRVERNNHLLYVGHTGMEEKSNG